MFLAIEIGGTKLQLAVGPGNGILQASWRGAVNVREGANGIRRQIIDAVPQLLEQANLARGDIRGVGVGFGGPVDDGTQCVIKSHQIEGWNEFPLAKWISELLGWPTVIGNDADVAGLGEAHFGAGKGSSPIFYITIGSGIGGGLIIDGHIYEGSGRGAAEIGHLRMPGSEYFHDEANVDGMPILEDCACGWAIERIVRNALASEAGRQSALWRLTNGEVEQVTARLVAQAAEAGDEFSLELLNRSWQQLAKAICHVITLLCPRRIVIGGGVSLMGERVLFEPLRKLVAERVFAPFRECYEIVPAALGEEVVLHGALALAKGRWRI